MIRDRDGICGEVFRRRNQHMGIEHVVMAPRSTWQNPFAERLIGSTRQKGLYHVITLKERNLRRILRSYPGRLSATARTSLLQQAYALFRSDTRRAKPQGTVSATCGTVATGNSEDCTASR